MEISSKSQAENGTDNNTIMTPLRVKQSIAANAGGGGGTSDYSSLTNKPQINSITLDGNKTGAQLGLASSSDIPTKTSDLQNDSNFAVTNANNNFSTTQRINGTVYSEASYIEKGGGIGLRATGPVPGPVTNENGAITFYQWVEEEPDTYTEITKAKISVANVLDLTNCNPYYVAYDENANQLVSSQLALMSNVPTKTSDLSNDTGYASTTAANTFSAQQTFSSTKTSSAAGYTTDQYGNFHHQQATASDEWELYDYSGNIRLKFIWETGELKLNNGKVYGAFVLYTGDDNTGPITLSDSAANYDHIDIVYRSNDGASYTSTKRVYDPNNKYVDLEYKYNLGSVLYTKFNKIGISGTQITLDTGFEYYWSTGTNSVTMSTANNIYITKVVGYK